MNFHNCLPKPFVTCHRNKKNNKIYYALARDLPELGSDTKYVLYQTNKDALFVREQKEFDEKFKDVEVDTCPRVSGRIINRITTTIMEPFLSPIADAVKHVALLDEEIIDATNINSRTERMMCLFYDPYTNSLWIAETKTPRINITPYKNKRKFVLKQDIQKVCAIKYPEKLPVFARTAKCNHALGEITRNNERKTIHDGEHVIIKYEYEEDTKYNKSEAFPYVLFKRCPLCDQKLSVKFAERIEKKYPYTSKGKVTSIQVWEQNQYTIDEKDFIESEPSSTRFHEGWGKWWKDIGKVEWVGRILDPSILEQGSPKEKEMAK